MTNDNTCTEVRDGRKGRFWVDDEIIDAYASALGVHGLAVYILLCRRAGKNGQSFPSVRRIAEDLGVSDRQAKRELKKLKDLDLIKIEVRRDDKGRQRSSVYTVLDTPPKKPSASESPRVQGDSETPGGEGSVSHPFKEDTESKEVTITGESPNGSSPVIGDDAKNGTAPEKLVTMSQYGVGRLMDYYNEAKQAGKRPTPIPQKQRRNYGEFYEAAVKDGYEVDDLEPVVKHLVARACGEGGQKAAWIGFGTALNEVEDGVHGDEPTNPHSPLGEKQKENPLTPRYYARISGMPEELFSDLIVAGKTHTELMEVAF